MLSATAFWIDLMLRQLTLRFLADGSGATLHIVAKSAAIIALFSVGAAYVLSERLDADRRALDRLAAETGRGVDMTATGSIRKAESVKLDPCVVPAKR